MVVVGCEKLGKQSVVARFEPYYCSAKHAPNSENDSSEDSEVDNRLGKQKTKLFANPVKDAKSVAGMPFHLF